MGDTDNEDDDDGSTPGDRAATQSPSPQEDEGCRYRDIKGAATEHLSKEGVIGEVILIEVVPSGFAVV